MDRSIGILKEGREEKGKFVMWFRAPSECYTYTSFSFSFTANCLCT